MSHIQMMLLLHSDIYIFTIIWRPCLARVSPQVVGYKYIRLYAEDQSHLLYAHPNPLLSNTSQADVEGPAEAWPLLQQARYQDLVLEPGEALYIPPRCWHYVRSLSTSFSVSFWWA